MHSNPYLLQFLVCHKIGYKPWPKCSRAWTLCYGLRLACSHGSQCPRSPGAGFSSNPGNP